ncbi:MAG: porin [Cyclobacteriaceae bacterium]
MKQCYLIFILLSGLLLIARLAHGQDTLQLEQVNFYYGSSGFEIISADGKYRLNLQSRFQLRFATPGDQNSLTLEDYTEADKRVFKVNRARFKVRGHAYRPWFKYYWEYELSRGNLLDFRIMLEKWPFLKLRMGQYKVLYSRERSISSGGQQLVDRSIINRPFTLDRQQGIELHGRVWPGRVTDFYYNLGVFTGTGRGTDTNDDRSLMYVGRLQWNVFGRMMEMEASDVYRHQKPVGSISAAAATNRSPFTRFSQAGGGQLEGFAEAADTGRYRVKQWVGESALMYRGFSWQQEYHRKYVHDLVAGRDVTLSGYYMQAGYFVGEAIGWFPDMLEVAARYARFRPDVTFDNNREEEFTVCLNYFISGHRNKVSTELSRFEVQGNGPDLKEGYRFRVQLDVSI